MEPRSGTSRIPTLDGWRAIAILAVLACHATGFLWRDPPYTLGIIREIMVRGSYGVDIFFGISGFLICTRILDDEQAAGRIELGRFYLRRAFRILPPYMAYLIVLSSLAWAGWLTLPRGALLKTAVFLQNYWIRSTDVNWYLGHFWSLAVEEHYYLLFPTLLIVCGARLERRLKFLVIGSLAIAAWRVVSFHFIGALPGGAGFYTRTDVRLDSLLFGAALAVAVRIPALGKILAGRKRIHVLGALGALLFLAGVSFEIPLKMLWVSVSVPMLLLWTIRNPGSLGGRFLEIPPIQWIGRLSYSLYLWNNFFFLPWTAQPVAQISPLQTFPWNLPALFLVAAASYYWIERPAIAFGHQKALMIPSSPEGTRGVEDTLS